MEDIIHTLLIQSFEKVGRSNYTTNDEYSLAVIAHIINSSCSNFDKMLALENLFMYCHGFEHTKDSSKTESLGDFDISNLKNIKF